MSPKVANSLPERSEIVECAVEDDIDKLFQAIDVRSYHHCFRKSAMKGSSPVRSRISNSESLKQALRGLSISQASNMAAVKKRTSRPSVSSPGVTEKCELGRPQQSKRAISSEISEKVSTVEIVPISDECSIDSRGAQKWREDKTQSESLWLSDMKRSREKAIDFSKHRLRSRKFAKKIMPNTARVSGINVQTPYYLIEKGIEKLEKVPMRPNSTVIRAGERSQLREKEEISQSSKSSIGEFSSGSTSHSEESSSLGGLHSDRRPHMSKDLRWEAINCIKKNHNGSLGLQHFKLLRKFGCVYVSELIGTGCLFAVKVMDNDILRARNEKEIVGILDHPFLPTLYADFTMGKLGCLVMDYCPCGNLNMLRQKQVTKSFSEQAARFYAAEVLLALEYLHLLGVVYRDLKPENILIREDGHIMLSNFNLSFISAVNEINSDSSCHCFPSTRKPKSNSMVGPNVASSNSFVGPTHEYLAPEIIGGGGHGSGVDWWSFGVVLYELLYGVKPFEGLNNEETGYNVAMECLWFPQHPVVSSRARDLIRGLLEKESVNRMGSTKGAVEVKEHAFFEGLDWALLRRETPPEVPEWVHLGGLERACLGGGMDFEMV